MTSNGLEKFSSWLQLTQKWEENDGGPQSLLDVGPLSVGAQVRGSLGLGQHDADDVDQEQQVDLENKS